MANRIDGKSAERIGRAVRFVEKRPLTTRIYDRARFPTGGNGNFQAVVVPSGGFPANTGSNPPFVTCTYEKYDYDSNTLSDDSITVDVYNRYNTAEMSSGGRAWIQWWAGRWWYVNGDCS